MAYSDKANPANTPITVNSGKVFTSQSMPAPTPRPVTTPPSSRKATDSAEVDEPFLSSSRLSSGDCKVALYLPFRGSAMQPSYSAEAAGGLGGVRWLHCRTPKRQV